MISEVTRARTRPYFVVLALAFGTLACFQPSALAQVDEDAEYKGAVEQALSEFRHKNWPEARVLFRRAHELQPSARTFRGMGIVSFEMRDYVQAVRDLSAALADTRQPLTEAQRRECDGLLARARTFVGVFDLKVNPPEADVKLDGGRLARESDGTVLLSFGEHVFRASLSGHQDASARVSVQGGERNDITLTLAPLPSAPALAPAEAEVEPAVSTREERVTLAPQPAFQRSYRGSGLRYTWLSLGLSAGFGGASAAFWFLGDKALSDLDAACRRDAAGGDPCIKGEVETQTVERYELLTNVALGASAGAFAAAAVLAIFEWPRERRLTMSIGPHAVSVRGAF